jgi:hypothetical protein
MAAGVAGSTAQQSRQRCGATAVHLSGCSGGAAWMVEKYPDIAWAMNETASRCTRPEPDQLQRSQIRPILGDGGIIFDREDISNARDID